MTQTTHLPTEILIQIVNYLTPQEKQNGLLICQDWYNVFRCGLYHNISIKTLHQLEMLLKSLSISSSASSVPNGHLVKILSIQKRTVACLEKMIQERLIIPRFLLEQLPDLCPNLEVLDFDPEMWKFICYHSNVSKWNHIRQLPTLASLGANLPILKDLGRGLRSLSIQSKMIMDISTQGRLVSILSLVPHINQLTIQGDQESTLNLTLNDMEIIHKLLPSLRNLRIVGDNIQLYTMNDEKETMHKVNSFPTAPQVTTLCINTRLTPITWLYYVAHKYPQLKHLGIDVHYDTSNTMENFQLEKALLLNLVHKCRHLEVLELSCPILSHWFNTSFFETLKGHQCIQEIRPMARRNGQIKFDADFSFALEQGKDLLTALEIEQWRLDAKLPCTMQRLRSFTKLASLELKCDSYHDEYHINTLLESCPVLKTLVLEWGSLITPSQCVWKRRRHPLKSLNMTFASFSTNLFDYLSLSCPYISAISLTKCKQICVINDLASQTVIELNLPNHHLNCLVLDGVRLDYSSASMFYHGLSSYIRLASVQTAQDTLWHHHVGYKTNNRKLPILVPLDANDSQITQAYFDKRKNSQVVYSSKSFLENLSEQKVDNLLKTNLMFGYIRINCKSIDHFYLDGNVNCQA
ncbi:Deoxycytidine kinase 1 [Mucor velutinosus]|uniref:Deoxycytidine kinase 1 n=1 Tax=Mucor velutinosus TaxID=708070 RepID=A0AAN7D951_9FUNG|nr:Deoxycytidine kinase 1 [Mucor velutinosus]